MNTFDNTNRGALFKNTRKETDKHPDYSGSINVGGSDFWLSGWLQTDKNGNKYFSLSVKQKDGSSDRPAPAAKPAQRMLDDEVPF